MSRLRAASTRTKVFVAVDGFVILVTGVLEMLRVGGLYGIAATSDVGNIVSIGITGVVILAVALSFPRGERLRLQWGVDRPRCLQLHCRRHHLVVLRDRAEAAFTVPRVA